MCILWAYTFVLNFLDHFIRCVVVGWVMIMIFVDYNPSRSVWLNCNSTVKKGMQRILTFTVFSISDFLGLVWRVPGDTVLAIIPSRIVLASLTNATPSFNQWESKITSCLTYDCLLPSNFFESNLHFRAWRLQLHSKRVLY